MKKSISIFDEKGILEYVKADIKICECDDEILQICDCGKKVKCVNCNNIVGISLGVLKQEQQEMVQELIQLVLKIQKNKIRLIQGVKIKDE